MYNKKITASDITEICRLYTEDEVQYGKIAPMYKVDHRVIKAILLENNIAIRTSTSITKARLIDFEKRQSEEYKQRFLKDTKSRWYELQAIEQNKVNAVRDKIIHDYVTEYLTHQELAEKYECNRGKLIKMLKKYKIKRPKLATPSWKLRRYPLNDKYFEVIDTKEKAYFLGLLFADGSNSMIEGKHRVQIGLQEGDRNVLDKFYEELGTNKPLFYRKAEDVKKYSIVNGKPIITRLNSYTAMITSKKLSIDLEKLGMVRRKSLVLKFPYHCVPEKLYNSFILGYFDGDGSIFISKCRAVCSPKLSFIGTYEMMESIRSILYTYCSGNLVSISQKRIDGKNTHTITYGGIFNIIRIVNWLYAGNHICLLRKKEIADLIKKNGPLSTKQARNKMNA